MGAVVSAPAFFSATGLLPGSGASLATDFVSQQALAEVLSQHQNPLAVLGAQSWRFSSVWQPRADVLKSVGAILANAAVDRLKNGDENRLAVDADGNVAAVGGAQRKRPEMLAIQLYGGGGEAKVESVAATPRQKMAADFQWGDSESYVVGTRLGPYLLDLVLALRGEGAHEGILPSAIKVTGNKTLSVPERIMALRLMQEVLTQEATFGGYSFESYLNAAELLIDILEDEASDPCLKEMALGILHSRFQLKFFVQILNLLQRKIPLPPDFKIGPGHQNRFSLGDMKKYEARIREVSLGLRKSLSEEYPKPSYFEDGSWLSILGDYLCLQTETDPQARFVAALKLASYRDLPTYKRGLALVYAFDLLEREAILQQARSADTIFNEYFEMLPKLRSEGNEELLGDAELLFYALIANWLDISTPTEADWDAVVEAAKAKVEISLKEIVGPDHAMVKAAREIIENARQQDLENTKKEVRELFFNNFRVWEQIFLEKGFVRILNSNNVRALRKLRNVLRELSEHPIPFGYPYRTLKATIRRIEPALKRDPSLKDGVA